MVDEVAVYTPTKVWERKKGRDNNVYRMVVGKDGKVYYSNSHYGDKPGKPFYEVGQLSKEQTQQIFKNNAGK